MDLLQCRWSFPFNHLAIDCLSISVACYLIPLLFLGVFCYVVAVIRQFEAFLKRFKMLPMDDSLSIQDFINQLPDGWELGVPDLSGVALLLEDHGVVSSRDGPPLTFVRGASTRTPAMRVYKPIGNIEILHEDYSDLDQVQSPLSRQSNSSLFFNDNLINFVKRFLVIKFCV